MELGFRLKVLLTWPGSTPFGAAGSNSTSLLAILRMSREVQGRSGSRANIRASWLVAALLVRRDNRAASCLGSRPNRASADSTLSGIPFSSSHPRGQTETDPVREAPARRHGEGPLNQLLTDFTQRSRPATNSEPRDASPRSGRGVANVGDHHFGGDEQAGDRRGAL
jgi:hypothetical protein